MMEEGDQSKSSCVPPGFRFHPTDEELVGYYLRKKVASQKIDLDVITDIDLYRIEPWDLQDKCRIGYEEQNEWYFFSHKDKKYPTGTRTNRATIAGFWKATGRDKAVYERSKLIGMRKTLVFYKGRAPNGQKTDWIMHEYRLHESFEEINVPLQEEGWVVCRAFKKRSSSTGQSTYYFEESSSSVAPRHPNMVDVSCKEELIIGGLQSEQLPHLESPSVHVAMKRNIDEDHHQSNSKKVIIDWRDLDKFVASQLSHGDYINNHHVEEYNSSDLAGLLLLQEQAGAGLMEDFNPINSTSSTDNSDHIGICVFNK